MLLRAKRGSYGGYPQLRNPVPVTTGEAVQPVYAPGWMEGQDKLKRVTGETVGRNIAKNLPTHSDHAVKLIEQACGLPRASIAELTGVSSLERWLKAVHAPETMAEAHAARKVARRIGLLESVVQAQQNASRPDMPRSRIAVDAQEVLKLATDSGVTPTGAQAKAIALICRAFDSPKALRAMITGDVGTGKSLVFCAPAALAARAGEIVAIMVPRDILIEKTARDIEKLKAGVEVIPYFGGSSKLAKPVGGAIIIGTHALNGALPRAGLEPKVVVIDEQQKFSQAQREASVRPHTNLIEVSATPIPRSVALLQTGGLELITLNEAPFQRQILTTLLDPLHKKQLWEFIGRIADHPTKQAAIIYPTITGSESQADKAKINGTLDVWERQFPGKVAVLHGDMPRERAEEALQRMANGKAKILIATTAIELGVTLPDLAAMVVVEPQRFGLNALHQLRGRLARHGGLGKMYLYPLEPLPEQVAARLNKLVNISDGFRLAEVDLAMRGAGELGADSQVQDGETRVVLPNLVITADDMMAEQ
ncbi:MAG: DEAD/DEAH box helicase, partial [Pseudomonas sp.]